MNIALLLELAADTFGDRVAFGPHDGGLTFADLRRATRGVARRIVEDHDHASAVAIIEPMSSLVPAALFGAAWAGVSYAPLNYHLTEAQLDEQLDRLRPVVVAAPNWVDVHSEDESSYPADPDSPAVLLFTSGTSAAPKTALLRHEQLLSYLFNTLEFAGAGEDEAALVSVPPFHIAGVAAVLSSTYIGRRIVPLPRFTPEEWIARVQAERITHATLVPTMLARVVHCMECDPSARVPTLRNLAYGGARMHLSMLERALALMPTTDFVNAYGLTETSSTVALLGPDDHRTAIASDDPAVRARLNSVGRPIPGIEIRIVDDEGVEAPTDTPGEIQIRGAQVSGDYVGTDSKVDAEGWLRTGDHGWLDADGYLFCEGRADDTIIRGGENIGPAEIEDALLQHDAISGAAVVGLPDLEWGEQVAAMITLRDGVTTVDLDHVREWVRARLGSLRTPQTIHVTPELPHTATGKVQRREVREQLLGLDA